MHNFCVLLHTMCEKYGKNPSYYLFNDLECKHTELRVDKTVFDIWARDYVEHQERERQKSAALP